MRYGMTPWANRGDGSATNGNNVYDVVVPWQSKRFVSFEPL